MYSFSKLHWYENTPWQTKPHQKLLEHKMCLTICIVTKPHLGKVCIFLPILFKGKLIQYIWQCHSNFIVLLPHISPWTQIWIQAFIVAYQNLTFKSVKRNCCFRNQRWDLCSKVSSGSEKRLHQIDQSECNIFFQNISNSNLNWFTDQPFSDWYIYKPVYIDMPHKWIGSTPK